ncbi:MAG: CoB--CoM heterodisulfide reductase iron-sulfur subunit B family protein [Desulfobacterales bacterium]|nr:CoB--CoM heterodisulfide reductase iron-sulfur subunit B family protein [Desulfobacterales bacterium]
MDIAYYPGCTLHQSSNLYDIQTKKILAKLNIFLREIKDWSCCGATSAGKTDSFLQTALPARNIGIAESFGFREMVVPCTGCYSNLITAQKKIKKDISLKDEINSAIPTKIEGNIKIYSILELLTKFLDAGDITKAITKKIQSIKAACYYGCLTRFSEDIPFFDDVENPQSMEKILDSIGAHHLDWNYKTFCCGASAAINDNETALNLMAKIFKDALSKGANCIVTSCPMCQLNLDAHQDKFCKNHNINERLPIFFITELLGVCMGFTPEELNADRHIIDGTSLIKELN